MNAKYITMLQEIITLEAELTDAQQNHVDYLMERPNDYVMSDGDIEKLEKAYYMSRKSL